MGQLNNLYLTSYSKNTEVFIETGTYHGDTVSVAYEFGFKQIHSIEIDYRLFESAKKRFQNHDQVMLHHGDSPDVLSDLIHVMNRRCTFWLDAHRSFSLNAPGSKKFGPSALLEELNSISKSSRNDHVIFIDDCRLLDTESWDYLPRKSVIEKLYQINPEYQLKYLDGGRSFGMVNPVDDILVAYV